MEELFNEWMEGVKKKILTLAEEKSDPVEIAAAIGMSQKAILILITTMAREGSIRITGIQPGNKRRQGHE